MVILSKRRCKYCNVKEGELHKVICGRCWSCNIKDGRLHKLNCALKTRRGRPHFSRVDFCNRCGKESPKIFMVSDKDWSKVTGNDYWETDVLCSKCIIYLQRKMERYKK